MGTVHAKEPTKEQSFNSDIKRKNSASEDMYYKKSNFSQEPTSNELNLSDVKVRVDKVHVDGLVRTKDDIVKLQVKDLFKAKNFDDVILHTYSVRKRLENLGCFKNIDTFIDTSKGPDATPDGIEVTFTIKELGRIRGSVNTSVGNNEGSVTITTETPNMFGRGERINAQYSYGTKSNQINISAIKPFFDSRHQKVLTTSIFRTSSDFPWSGYKLSNMGFLVNLALSQGKRDNITHNFQYEADVRNVTASKQAAFQVREQCGPTLKSSVRHIFAIDKRDATLFPTKGSLIELTTEFAGLGGNIGFVKNELNLQTNWTLFKYFTFQLGVQSGFLRGISNDLQINIVDQFFLGGPLSLRGFEMRGCGPQKSGNAVGGDIYWASALHLYTPLPFRPSFAEFIKLHGFVNGGNLDTLSRIKTGSDYDEYLKIFTQNVRCSMGCGIAMVLGNIARIELNVIMPLLFSRSDILTQFQFGIGVKYL
ncbi:sorting and assembly machinery component 50 homolog [Leptopilina heterotoma]|uniref:sorting and assembly machinery component 50 homolog n=1 Tax=Leptopilina heterotoma TaxID=63436 RepID=UPI001CA85907|nr:sorting and assembly machinery component 50 homolog [Leptopilina heterotoma]